MFSSLAKPLTTLALLIACAVPAQAEAICQRGVYGADHDHFVVLGGPSAAPATGQRYLLRDGRRGATGDADSIVTCDADVVTYRLADGGQQRWARQPTRETPTTFDSAQTRLAGQLIEPAEPADTGRPLVVLVHGSEKTSAIGSIYAYMLAAQGVSVFVFDKRGTGASEGEYTQNFELLADDAAAALAQARHVAAGRFGRAGFFGGSQGGWVAPLAATRSQADFVAVGFGLVVSPIEEDREQLFDEARILGLGKVAQAQVERLSHATSLLVRSHFATGYRELARVKAEIGPAPWAATIKGEYSGDMLRMREADLKRVGRARFDNLELIWDYDAVAALRRLRVPLLWVLAGEDREAPIAQTQKALTTLAHAGIRLDAYIFPGTDHGIVEFRTNQDGTRTPTRIADGYLELLADWIKERPQARYGNSVKID